MVFRIAPCALCLTFPRGIGGGAGCGRDRLPCGRGGVHPAAARLAVLSGRLASGCRWSSNRRSLRRHASCGRGGFISSAPALRSCQGACARAVAGQPTADLRTGMRPAVAAGTSGARVLQSCRGVCGRTVAGRRSQSSAPLCCAAIFAPPQILMRSSNVSAAAGLCMIHASQRRPRSLRSALIFLPPVIFVKGGMPLRGLTCRCGGKTSLTCNFPISTFTSPNI